MTSNHNSVLACIGVAIILPILILVMLPSLIFGPLFSDGTDRQNGFIDEATMLTNIEDVNMSLSTLMQEGIKRTLQAIDCDFALSGMDEKVVINTANADTDYNVNQFISMYCTAKNDRAEEISLDDMTKVIESSVDKLYSFTYIDSEAISHSETDPDNDEGSQETIRIRTYTIIYNGEDYFADEIFYLTEAEKAIADDYATNLSILFSDGYYQKLTESSPPQNYGEIQLSGGKSGVVYYNQLDERWYDASYGIDHVGSFGCGPTAMAMVVSSLSESAVLPDEMAKWAFEHGYWCKKNGSYRTLISGAASAWGLKVESCGRSQKDKVLNALKEGKLVVALEGKGHFTSSGHFIVLRGIDSQGGILIADPASYERSQKSWNLALILSESSRKADKEGPFWIIG